MRRFAGILACLVFLLGATAGCAPSTSDGPVTLRFLSLAWQQESIEITKKVVAEFNRTHAGVRVEYVQGSWDNVHDQLLTSFEGGEAPDIIHNAADDLAEFAHGGYLADLTDKIPDKMRSDIPKNSWNAVRFDGGIYGVPFAHEPKVLVANRKALRRANVRIPTPENPWSWEEFSAVTAKLTGSGRYGVAWPLKEPVSLMLHLSQDFGGRFFYEDNGGTEVRFGPAEQRLLELVDNQINNARTAAPSSLGMSGSDALPGFFAGKYAMIPLGLSYRQQVVEQAPASMDWVTLPVPAAGSQAQGVVPVTLSVAAQSEHQQAATEFVRYLAQPKHTAKLALGDWMLPTSRTAMRQPELNTSRHGWDVGVAAAPSLRTVPAQRTLGYREWKDKIATPALQRYFGGEIAVRELGRILTEDGNHVLQRYQR